VVYCFCTVYQAVRNRPLSRRVRFRDWRSWAYSRGARLTKKEPKRETRPDVVIRDESGNQVVLEVKQGSFASQTEREVLNQLLAYMDVPEVAEALIMSKNKTERLELRASREQKQVLETLAKHFQLTISEFVFRLVFLVAGKLTDDSGRLRDPAQLAKLAEQDEQAGRAATLIEQPTVKG